MSFSLYIHIPYCHSKCPYCDFNSYAALAWPEAEYTSALVTEMAYRAASSPWTAQHIKTIFFGGGTPSLFAPDSISSLIDAADRLFGIEPDAEITLEANPGTVNEAKLAGFKAAGVNRLSFGAQSFDPAILNVLGRIHSSAETRAAVEMAHRASFDHLNLDLIFAVPGQQLAHVERDIVEATALQPDHISAYNLTFEEGTAFFSDMKRGRIRPLAADDQAAMFELVRGELPRLGYRMYEISNYAPAGHESRHNLSYWRAESYLGIGAGAHSCALDETFRFGRRWWNERVPARYMAGVDKAGIAEAGFETIDKNTLEGEFVFLNLRLCKGFQLSEFCHRFGESFDSRFGDIAGRLIDGGLLVRTTDRIF
ncbi:MAG TPA: radical SAM family heme chaperone HemW, partial [Candidatus Binataceae bacterium]|nr:radical SAM family heme chaperone HemW [Candidatus Binataceae bacterium]